MEQDHSCSILLVLDHDSKHSGCPILAQQGWESIDPAVTPVPSSFPNQVDGDPGTGGTINLLKTNPEIGATRHEEYFTISRPARLHSDSLWAGKLSGVSSDSIDGVSKRNGQVARSSSKQETFVPHSSTVLSWMSGRPRTPPSLFFRPPREFSQALSGRVAHPFPAKHSGCPILAQQGWDTANLNPSVSRQFSLCPSPVVHLMNVRLALIWLLFPSKSSTCARWPRSRRVFQTKVRVPPVPRFWGPGRKPNLTTRPYRKSCQPLPSKLSSISLIP
jgi:hypothetical protein